MAPDKVSKHYPGEPDLLGPVTTTKGTRPRMTWSSGQHLGGLDPAGGQRPDMATCAQPWPSAGWEVEGHWKEGSQMVWEPQQRDGGSVLPNHTSLWGYPLRLLWHGCSTPFFFSVLSPTEWSVCWALLLLVLPPALQGFPPCPPSLSPPPFHALVLLYPHPSLHWLHSLNI